MKPQVNAASQPQLESQVFPKAEMSQSPASDNILSHHARHYFTREERTNFYAGNDRLSLLPECLKRVRELHDMNDSLQRQIAKCEKELETASDALAIHAEIEHCHIMIARNTGEILNIYSMNDSRLRRIAELESQNLELNKNMDSTQSSFISTRDMAQRTQHATDFFLNKATFERNTQELRRLNEG
jgi:hypothetical protein